MRRRRLFLRVTLLFDQGLENLAFKAAPCRTVVSDFFFVVTYFASNSGFNRSAYTA